MSVNSNGIAPLSPCADGTLCCGWANDTTTTDCCAAGLGGGFGSATFVGPFNISTLQNATGTTDEAIAGLAQTTVTVTATNAKGRRQRSHHVLLGVSVSLGISLALALATLGWLVMILRKGKRDQPLLKTPRSDELELVNRQYMAYTTGVEELGHNYIPHEVGGDGKPALCELNGPAISHEVPG